MAAKGDVAALRVCITCVLLCVSSSLERQETTSERVILNRLLHPDIYDATIRPGADTGEVTRVELDVTLNSIGPVNDIEMMMSTSFFLRQKWRDPRLQFTDFNTSIVVSYKRLDSLWVPDLYFTQSKAELVHVVTTPNILIRLFPDGSIMYSQRLSITVGCPMDLLKFPMDKQTCTIDMESYSFTMDAMYFVWSEEREGMTRMPGANIPDFTITGLTAADCSSSYAIGNFTCLRAVIDLQREIGFYATQTYIPSILIVVLSWASFWIDHEAVPARISVGLLTVLTITTQSSGASAQLPRVPYIKAIDIWMSACLVFVFAAYMEYAVVTVLSRRHRKRGALARQKENQDTPATSMSDISVGDKASIDPQKTAADGARVNSFARVPGRFVDKTARFVFPASFLIFNLIYWVYYLHTA